ncbi:GNAT family acetyltransferase [Shigella flexneri]|nr:GNAT family acetyltransferase [Shigella flexneri]
MIAVTLLSINLYALRASLKKSVRNSDCAAKALIDRQSGELIGICTFTAYSLERQRVSGVLQGSQPSEIGVVRLVMLGGARKYQKRGFGQDLLCDFFEHVKKFTRHYQLKGFILMLTLPPLTFMLVSALFSFQRHQMLLVLYLCFWRFSIFSRLRLLSPPARASFG